MSANNSLLFIPDISGFTRFVNQTEQEHSRHIIAELMESLIDANTLDMTLAEIEGDALFFYKFESVPSFPELMAQIEQMFVHFHSQLQRYEHQRICQCGACSTAERLSLKFIVHAGAFNFIQIKDHRKPYGKEIITAHRLLKNNVPDDEYALFSHAALEAMQMSPASISHEALSMAQSDQVAYGEIGAVDYDFLLLAPLKEKVFSLPPLKSAGEVPHPISDQIFVELSPDALFQFIINFEHRPLWNKGVDGFEYDKNKINRAGTLHNCVIQGQQLGFETVKSQRKDNTLVYGERTTDVPLIKEMTSYFILKEEGKGTRLQLEFHPVLPTYLAWLLRPLLNIKIKKQLSGLLKDLKEAAEGLYPSQSHSPPDLSRSRNAAPHLPESVVTRLKSPRH